MHGSLVRPLPRPNARRTLLCLSYCGGGTAPVRPWASLLPDDVELAALCYPGRESRFAVPFSADWEELIGDVLAAVRSLAYRPYLLLGHSMGAWVAFDLAHRMEREGGRAPDALVVSASAPPTWWAVKRERPPTVRNTDDELLTWMSTVGQLPPEVLAEPELRQIALDMFRADLRVMDSYRYPEGAVVRCPVHVLYGEEDPEVDLTAARCWEEVAGGTFTVTALPGGHFYTPQVWARLPERLDWLRQLNDSPSILAQVDGDGRQGDDTSAG